ncbi:MAG: phosphatase PAP2 family protein [Aeromonadaceae bacterium]|nr:phosphatase PAP2 family protein [Aeromonadaceae bacterium]
MDQITRLDVWVSRLCLSHGYNHIQARISRLVSRTGDGPLYLLLALLLAWLDGERGMGFLRAGLTVFALELPLYLLLKNYIKRERPSGLPVFIRPSDRYSLPSGHTAAAFVMASLVAIHYPSMAPLAFVWAAVIGASRLLLGVHFLTDLIAGALLGSGCTLLVLL